MNPLILLYQKTLHDKPQTTPRETRSLHPTKIAHTHGLTSIFCSLCLKFGVWFLFGSELSSPSFISFRYCSTAQKRAVMTRWGHQDECFIRCRWVMKDDSFFCFRDAKSGSWKTVEQDLWMLRWLPYTLTLFYFSKRVLNYSFLSMKMCLWWNKGIVCKRLKWFTLHAGLRNVQKQDE